MFFPNTQATVEADISMYADDHQIFSSDHSIGRVEEKLLHDGSKITKWFEENLLQVNIKKYQSMVLGERNGTVEMNMQIGGVKIEQSHSIKLKEREKRYNLRNSDFTLPRFNTIKYGKHSLKYLGPFLWSKLTKEERGMDSVSTFKRRIRKRDLTHLIEDGGCKNCHLCNS